MKGIFLTALLLSFTASLSAQTPSAEENFKKLSWLEGTWMRTNAKPGKKAYEQWKKSGEFTLKGRAFIVKGNDSTFIEKTSLVIKENAIYYVADVPQNNQEILFKLTSINDTGFVCENPMHDFPKKISYQLTGLDMKATISDETKSIDYLFQKVK